MALDDNSYKTALVNLFKDIRDTTKESDSSDSVINKLAEGIVTATKAYIKAGDVKVGKTHIAVIAPPGTAGGPCTVTTIKAASIDEVIPPDPPTPE